MKRRLLALAAVFALAACGGGGGGSTPGTQPPVTTPPASTPHYSALTISWRVGTGSVRTPRFVSPNAAKVEVLVNTVNGGAPPAWVNADVTTTFDFTPVTGNCTAGGGISTCTIQVAAPVGSVNYTFKIKDSSNNVLSIATQTLTIVQGTANNLSVTLNGIVSTVTVSGAALNANNTGLASTGETLTVNAKDASGATIIGADAYSNSITLTETDATGQTALHLNGGSGTNAVTVSSPADVVTMTYTGQAANNVAIAATGTGITGGGTITANVSDVAITGATLDDPSHGGSVADLNYAQQTLSFSTPSGSQPLSATELGWTNAPFNQQFTVDPGDGTNNTCGTGAGAFATASAGPATSFTITAQNVGLCSMRIKETGTGYPVTGHTANASGNATHDGTFWVSVTSGHFTIQTASSFLSSQSQSVKITKNSPGSVTSVVVNINPLACPCQVTGTPWSLGQSNNYTLTTYDGTGGSGNALDRQTLTFTPTAGTTNQDVNLQGIPFTAAITGVPAAWNANTSGQTATLTVTVKDHAGTTISGTYASAVRITDPDVETTNGTKVTGTHLGSGCTTTCVDMLASGDTVTLNYGGLAENPVVLASSNTDITANSGTAGTATFTPLLQAIVKDNGPTTSLGGDGIDLFTTNSGSATGYSGTEQYKEPGFTNAPYNKTLSLNLPGGGTLVRGRYSNVGSCSSFATLSKGTNDTTHGTPFTATAIASPTAGQCTLTVTDLLTDQPNALPTFKVTYTTSQNVISGRPGH